MVLDWEEALWTVPEANGVTVRVWPNDMPEWGRDRYLSLSEGECWKVSLLREQAPQWDFAFRSLSVFSDMACETTLGVSPVLLDIDLDRYTPEDVEIQRARVQEYAARNGWACRTYDSGTGYHVEVAPFSVVGEPWMDVSNYAALVGSVREELDARGFGKYATIDSPHDWVRVAGSRNRKGRVKRRVT
jgi:hypothetical protein